MSMHSLCLRSWMFEVHFIFAIYAWLECLHEDVCMGAGRCASWTNSIINTDPYIHKRIFLNIQVYVWMCIFVLEKIVTREIFIYFAAFHRFSEGFSCIQHFYIFYAIPGLYDTTPITQMHIHMHIRVHIFIHKHINQFKSKYRNTRDALLQIYKYKKNWERRNGNTRTYLTTATT